MADQNLHLQIDMEEVREACELFASWAPRAHELPEGLRAELAAVAIAPAETLVDVKPIGADILIYEAFLSPRLRALVGNLRARNSDRV